MENSEEEKDNTKLKVANLTPSEKVIMKNTKSTSYNKSLQKVGPEIFVSTNMRSIHEDYSIRETLGQGAYGKVVKVIHRRSGIVRAMKSIKKNTVL